MLLFISEFMNVILAYLPVYALTLYPLWKTRGAKARSVSLFLLGNTAFLGAALVIFQRIWGMDLMAFQYFKWSAGLPTVIMPFFVFRKRAWKNIFLLSMSFVYTLIPNGMGNYAVENWFSAWARPMIGANIVSAAVIITTLPSILFLLRRLCENPDMKQATTFWRLMWLLPAVLFTVTTITSSYIDGGSDKSYAFIVVRALVYGALLLVCYLFDATVRQIAQAEAVKRKADELAVENHLLDTLGRMKTEFFQNMSHDLKTPLTVISTDIYNAADYLDYEMDPEDMRGSLDHAQREVMRMAHMVDGALQYSLMQESREGTGPADTAAFLREGAKNYRTILERNGNRLILGIPGTLPGIRGCTDMLLHVLSNLLSNANRYTKNGEISIHARAEEGAVAITVRDSGTGIKPELLPHIFERGVSDGGTGLGLAICKSAIEALGGEITAESEYGHGTAITFTLPMCGEETPDG